MTQQDIFQRFAQLKVLIIGDVMIDSYIWGNVHRISPEAPVPIVNVQQREQRLGGAGNVALNVQSLGATPLLCSVIGADADGETLMRLFAKNELRFDGLVQSAQRITTIKHRILAGSQHILRVDSETDKAINEEEQQLLWQKIQKMLPECQVVIFEDYDKGVLNENIIQKTIQLAKSLQIPTVVDPKKRNFLAYRHASLFKPNLKELKEGLKLDFEADDQAALAAAVAQLRQQLSLEGVLLTLSERGVYISHREESHHLPAHLREIADVSGAGDTVVSIAALCLALGLPPKQVAALANLGGGLVCEHLGVVPIDKALLAEEATRLQLV